MAEWKMAERRYPKKRRYPNKFVIIGFRPIFFRKMCEIKSTKIKSNSGTEFYFF